MYYLLIIFLIALSAIFSGLNLGFFSIGKHTLKRKAELGDKKAIKVYSIRRNGNLLLCTLLIGNVLVNSALSIFLGSILGSGIAILLATILIVLFGEIMPQATFSRYALNLGSKFVWIIKIFLFLLYPICKPLSMILDKTLGQELPAAYSKEELIKLVEDQEELDNSNIEEHEERIIRGALSYSGKRVKNIMIPRDQAISLGAGQKLTEAVIDKIRKSGHSRIPVYERSKDNIVGIFYVKDLIHHHWQNKRVGDIMRQNVIFVGPNENLDDLLAAFKKNRKHMFIVLDQKEKFIGVVTVEDVIEEIIGEEIFDEFDIKKNDKK